MQITIPQAVGRIISLVGILQIKAVKIYPSNSISLANESKRNPSFISQVEENRKNKAIFDPINIFQNLTKYDMIDEIKGSIYEI